MRKTKVKSDVVFYLWKNDEFRNRLVDISYDEYVNLPSLFSVEKFNKEHFLEVAYWFIIGNNCNRKVFKNEHDTTEHWDICKCIINFIKTDAWLQSKIVYVQEILDTEIRNNRVSNDKDASIIISRTVARF